MPPLTIVFEQGFDDDLAIVRVDGREVERIEHLTTRLLVGYAGSRRIVLPDDTSEIEVDLPDRNLSATIALPTPPQPFVTVSVRDDRLVLAFTDEALGYL